MNDYDIQEEVDQLKEKIDKRMSHPFLKKHGDMPEVDGERVSMLYRMFRETSLSHHDIDTYIVTVMLVQAALDAHESIDIRKLSDDRAQTSRQLTILGGDYFSGLYYYLLSEIEDILLVRRLATSIQEINEHKMFLYKNNRQTLEGTIDSLRIVESSLLRNVANYFEQPVWAAFFEEYFLLRRLLTEKHLYLESNSSSLLRTLDHSEKKRNLLLGSRQEKVQQFNLLLDSYIDRARQSVEKLFLNHSRFENLLGGRIWEIALNPGAFKQKLAEEG
ncbi:MAG TPA: heptaprenyl diphosphate synthase component 1 [Bacillales bacterium]|nr:heptaprenyl diphosphate synthase component 1 [Bacillales bacterium]